MFDTLFKIIVQAYSCWKGPNKNTSSDNNYAALEHYKYVTVPTPALVCYSTSVLQHQCVTALVCYSAANSVKH